MRIKMARRWLKSLAVSPANLITSNCWRVRRIADGLKSSSQTVSDGVVDANGKQRHIKVTGPVPLDFLASY